MNILNILTVEQYIELSVLEQLTNDPKLPKIPVPKTPPLL